MFCCVEIDALKGGMLVPSLTVGLLAMIIYHGRVGTRTPKGKAWVGVAAAILFTDSRRACAETRVAADIVPEYYIIRAIPRVMGVLLGWEGG